MLVAARPCSATASVPLLGPPTSIGDFHHGAWYYYLLAPAALSERRRLAARRRRRSSPLAGIAAVGVTWWLARSIGGPSPGSPQASLMAVSIAVDRRIDVHLEPEPHRADQLDRAGRRVACLDHGARPLVAAGRGRHGGHDAVHVLGVAFVPIVAALLVADIRRAPATPATTATC